MFPCYLKLFTDRKGRKIRNLFNTIFILFPFFAACFSEEYAFFHLFQALTCISYNLLVPALMMARRVVVMTVLNQYCKWSSQRQITRCSWLCLWSFDELVTFQCIRNVGSPGIWIGNQQEKTVHTQSWNSSCVCPIINFSIPHHLRAYGICMQGFSHDDRFIIRVNVRRTIFFS